MSESVTADGSPCSNTQRKSRRISNLAISSRTSDFSCSVAVSANSKFNCLIMV